MKATGRRAKPFTPRSLVGMTRGARKRAWLLRLTNLDDSEQDEARRLLAEIRVDAPFLGTKLGERLRPCPGCCNCQPCYCGNPSTCIGLYDSMYVHDKPSPACDVCCGHGCEDGHCYKRDDAITCDGSGVIPARKKGSKP